MIQPWILKSFSFHPLFVVAAVAVIVAAAAVKVFVLSAAVIAAAVAVVDGQTVYSLVVTAAGCGSAEL